MALATPKVPKEAQATITMRSQPTERAIQVRTKLALAEKRTGACASPDSARLQRRTDGGRLSPPSCPIARAYELRAEGLSIRKIAAQLDAEGHPSRGEKGWNRTTIERLLAREPARAPERIKEAS